MHGCDNRTDGKAPLETQPDIEQDRHEGDCEPKRSRARQLARNNRANHFDAAEVVFLGQLRPDDAGCGLLGIVARFLRRNPHQHVLARAHLLDLDLAKVQLVEAGAEVGNVDGTALGVQLDDRAALEVHTQIEPDTRKQEHRGRRQGGHQDEHRIADPHKTDVQIAEAPGSNALRQAFRRPLPEPTLHDQTGHRIGGEKRGDAADRESDGETAHWPGTEIEQDGAGDQHRQVRVENAAEHAREGVVDRAEQRLATTNLLAKALVDQHVRIDRDADRQDDAGNPRQGQRRP
ncbi:hypothetical protein D9M68_667440 [compost metagenome]